MTSPDPTALALSGARVAEWQPLFGAVPESGAVRFRVWAPAARNLSLLVREPNGIATYSPQRRDDGIWEFVLPGVGAGTRYAYSIDGGDPRPDPASRFQPDGVHGWSAVVDPAAFEWHDSQWTGVDPARLIVYELHVGTFTNGGTFASAAERLDYLRDLGVTAIELMPLADFPGSRNWGYDGVALFAPSRTYGTPDDLRAFIDRAHALDLGVLLDVVYNHLGPEGAYLPSFSPAFLTDAHSTPWGKAVNLDRAGSDLVRALLIENALHWIHEYHLDGLRLDATHALIDTREDHFLRELTRAVHAARERPPLVFAEDHRNLASMIRDVDRGGWGLDGIWADDFHHIVRRALGGTAHGYFIDYEGRAEELAETLRRGWFFVGQPSAHHHGPRGTDPSDVPMRKAVIAVQNHDQIGNRALGDRLHHSISAAEWRAAVTLLLTAPMTPLLFMGQEWSASTPFQFFTDFEPSLGEKVIEGRRREFKAFPEFATEAGAARVPNPQAIEAFHGSRLRWDEREEPEHAAVLALHRALLHLRAARPALRASDAGTSEAVAIDEATILLKRPDPESAFVDAASLVVCVRLRGSGRVTVDLSPATECRVLLSTEDPSFTTDPQPIAIDGNASSVTFSRPGAVILEVAAVGRR